MEINTSKTEARVIKYSELPEELQDSWLSEQPPGSHVKIDVDSNGDGLDEWLMSNYHIKDHQQVLIYIDYE